MYRYVQISILLVYLLHCCNGGQLNEATVSEYVEIIEKRIEEAKKYNRSVDASAYKPNSSTIIDYGIFDYIIIGAGSSGSVIANRLSERKEWQILLLEAGTEEDIFSVIPAMTPYLQGSDFNWGYNTVPQKNACQGMVDKSCVCPRGKGLGGSSIINAVTYSRGNKLDYDKWDAERSPGWSYKRVLTLFKKSEHSTIDGDLDYHGENGLWNVEYHKPNNNTEVLSFLKANLNLGIPLVDYNGKRESGASFAQLSTLNGRRQSLANAFLRPAQIRKNLRILTKSYVVKILINNVTKETEGVLFSREGNLYKVKVQQEVVLSAGAINSPHLLMVSGVGPAKHLQEHGIPVIQDLPVGENLQDHPTFYGLTFESNYTLPNISLEQMVEEYLNGTGWLTVALGAEALGFYEVPEKSGIIPESPNIELLNSATMIGTDYQQQLFRYTDETFNALTSKGNLRNIFTISVVFLHPKAKGNVRLKSASPFDYPLIDPKLLDDPEGDDIDMMYKGIQLAINLIRTESFQKLNARLLNVTLPQCREHEYLSKEYWYCSIRHLTSTLYHPTGTCKMGPDPKKGAVVDSLMIVHGVKNLRVADASIIPFPLSGHPSAPTAMIGEYVSCLLKEDMCWDF